MHRGRLRHDNNDFCHEWRSQKTVGKRRPCASCRCGTGTIRQKAPIRFAGRFRWRRPFPTSRCGASLNLTVALVRGGDTVTYAYDALGRLTSERSASPATKSTSAPGAGRWSTRGRRREAGFGSLSPNMASEAPRTIRSVRWNSAR